MKPTTKFQALIFDFNGVLLWDDQSQRDSWRAFAAQLRTQPLSDEEIDTRVHGRNGQDTLKYLMGATLDTQKAAALMEEKETIYRKICLASGTDFQLSPGATGLLNDLVKYKIPHTIATASAKNNVDFFIENLNLAKWFEIEKIVFDNGEIAGKPAPDLYLKAAHILRTPTAACVVVEDSYSGIQAAHAAGAGWIIALGPVENHATLASLPGVDQVISHLGQIVCQDLFDLCAGGR